MRLGQGLRRIGWGLRGMRPGVRKKVNTFVSTSYYVAASFGRASVSAVKVKVAFRECPRPRSLLLAKAPAGEMDLGTNKRL